MSHSPTSHLAFHNAYLEPRANGAYQISRYPSEVRHQLNEGARRMGMDSCGAEIRFHTTAPITRITLSCDTQDGEVQIYRGPFFQESHTLKKGVPTVLECAPSPRLQEASDEILESGGFSTGVWRILLGRGSFLFHHLESFGHPVRPPESTELSAVNWLAYGSSITHSHLAGHPYHAARLLHWNLFAKGLSGSCHIEPAASDYLAGQVKEQNLDLVTAELGVNIRACYTVEAFTERAAYFIQTLRTALAGKPLVLISIFTNSEHYSRTQDGVAYHAVKGFDASLRQLVKETNDPTVHLIEGCELLPDFTLLSADVLHPAPSGQALMGHLLAERLHRLLPGKTNAPAFAARQ